MSCAPCEAAKAAIQKGHNIVQGYNNLLFKNEEVELVAKARYDVCLACPNKSPLIIVNGVQYYICNICKCPIDAKIRAVNEVCPIGNW